MTWQEFEEKVCEIFFESGFWAHRISKDKRGAQPFDVIAIRGSEIYAFDCKVCSRPRLSLARAESNQLMSMTLLERRTTACTGFLAWHDGGIYMIPSCVVKAAIMAGEASIKLDQKYADNWKRDIVRGDEDEHYNSV